MKKAARISERANAAEEVNLKPTSQRLVIFALLGAIWAGLSACAEDEVRTVKPAAPAPTAINVSAVTHPEVTPAGNTLFILPMDPAEKTINKQHQRMVQDFLASYFRRQGFVVVDNLKEAYTSVYVGAGQYLPTIAGTKLIADEIEETVVENGKLISHEKFSSTTPANWLGVTMVANAYGQRPKAMFAVKVYSSYTLDNYWNEIMTAIKDKLDAQSFTVPKENTKMAGPPGCSPRFGFDDRYIVNGKNEFYKVTRVPKGSPGQKAGLKEGDVIEAVDSVPFVEWSAGSDSSEAYTKMIPVPIKYTRNGKTIRGTIQARVMCD
jgi:hypothetical protein